MLVPAPFYALPPSRLRYRPWWERLLIQLGSNTLIALITPCLLWVSSGAAFSASRFWQHFLFSWVYSNCIGLLAWQVVPPLWTRIWLRCRRFARALAGVVLLFLVAVAGCLCAGVLLSFAGLNPWQDYWREFAVSVRVSLVITAIFGSGAIAMETMRSQLDAATRALREQERQRQEAEKLATAARLSSLESRVHPHFLFNALNSISSLITEDPPRAERLLGRMAALLRFSLDAHQRGLVPLATEAKIVEDYLEIEQARFGHRLSYRIEIPPRLRQCEVPPLSIQTLVENSVKFAVSPRREGGLIVVSAREEESGVVITVLDDGPGFRGHLLPIGHGLDTLQARLLALFGDTASLRIERVSGRTTVALQIPRLAAVS